MRYPKVVVIGAGSLFFGRQAIWQMVYSEYLNGGTLRLVDTEVGCMSTIHQRVDNQVIFVKKKAG